MQRVFFPLHRCGYAPTQAHIVVRPSTFFPAARVNATGFFPVAQTQAT
ncbi:MAG: hypothetical protein P1S60_19125 [Anaerolineae bacterium]|nr:hypothetical protein [Anaerolineae bacterium]